jgi:hypothetical protein
MISIHSYIGIFTVTGFVVQWLVAFVVFVKPGLAQSTRTSFLPRHAVAGSVLFAGAITAALIGVYRRFATESGWLMTIVFVLIALGAAITVATLRRSKGPRAPGAYADVDDDSVDVASASHQYDENSPIVVST